MAATVLGPQLHKFDESYLEGLRTRDAATEAHFVSYFSPLLRLKLRKRYLSPEHIQDVLQETFLRVIDKLHSKDGIRQAESFGAFVNRVCANVLHESYRHVARFGALDDLPAEPPDESMGPQGRLDVEEMKRSVHRTLGRLSPKDRNLLRAVFLEERDKDEVCDELGVDRNYLRLLLHRAKHQFAGQHQ